MMQTSGILRWGKLRRRNVICKAAEVGPSEKFQWNRRKVDVEEPGMFHVVTTKNKEVHFVCDGGVEMAESWVRGIRLSTMEHKNKLRCVMKHELDQFELDARLIFFLYFSRCVENDYHYCLKIETILENDYSDLEQNLY
ncbi:hypothetical protein V6N12_030197 [Hibiscus sabdariffa]